MKGGTGLTGQAANHHSKGTPWLSHAHPYPPLLLVYVGSFPVSRPCILLLSIQLNAASSLDQAARGGDVPSPPFLPPPFCLGLQMCALSLSWLGTSLLSSSVRLLWCLPHSCFWWSCLAWRMAGLVWLPLAGLFAFFLPLPLPL